MYSRPMKGPTIHLDGLAAGPTIISVLLFVFLYDSVKVGLDIGFVWETGGYINTFSPREQIFQIMRELLNEF